MKSAMHNDVLNIDHQKNGITDNPVLIKFTLIDR